MIFHRNNYSDIDMDISRRIKIRHLEAFVEVARQKSVGRAAITLSLTQPAW
ncbi:LysR family transcriptional regulator [Hoeflea alexandrii]|nr:LysR family transcriptional regulator [Hoeflea alexandrii]MCY0154122.1 LysR family transcriptional regulator [Hoeflea alexandrii]